MNANNVVPAFIRDDRWRIAGMVTNLLLINGKFVGTQAISLEFAAHQVLGRLFGPKQGWVRDKLA